MVAPKGSGCQGEGEGEGEGKGKLPRLAAQQLLHAAEAAPLPIGVLGS